MTRDFLFFVHFDIIVGISSSSGSMLSSINSIGTVLFRNHSQIRSTGSGQQYWCNNSKVQRGHHTGFRTSPKFRFSCPPPEVHWSWRHLFQFGRHYRPCRRKMWDSRDAERDGTIGKQTHHLPGIGGHVTHYPERTQPGDGGRNMNPERPHHGGSIVHIYRVHPSRLVLCVISPSMFYEFLYVLSLLYLHMQYLLLSNSVCSLCEFNRLFSSYLYMVSVLSVCVLSL